MISERVDVPYHVHSLHSFERKRMNKNGFCNSEHLQLLLGDQKKMNLNDILLLEPCRIHMIHRYINLRNQDIECYNLHLDGKQAIGLYRHFQHHMISDLVNNAPEIINDDEYKEMKHRRFLYQKIRFPSNVPRSKIVFNGMGPMGMGMDGGSIDYNDEIKKLSMDLEIDHEEFLRECKLKAFTLYRKYVVGGCGSEET